MYVRACVCIHFLICTNLKSDNNNYYTVYICTYLRSDNETCNEPCADMLENVAIVLSVYVPSNYRLGAYRNNINKCVYVLRI